MSQTNVASVESPAVVEEHAVAQENLNPESNGEPVQVAEANREPVPTADGANAALVGSLRDLPVRTMLMTC